MNQYPDFMKSNKNRIDRSQQNTKDINGYYYEGKDGSQVAFWEAHAERTSQKHTHPFDEYMICVSGTYTAHLDGREIVLGPGDELLIPKGTEQWGTCAAGTRTVHVFGGKRIRQAP